MEKLPTDVWANILRRLGQAPEQASRPRWRSLDRPRDDQGRQDLSRKPPVDRRIVPSEFCALRLTCREMARELAHMCEVLHVVDYDTKVTMRKGCNRAPLNWPGTFCNVREISVHETRSDSDLSWLQSASKLTSVEVYTAERRAEVVGRHISQLSKVQNVRELTIHGLQHDTDMSSLQAANKLKYLNLVAASRQGFSLQQLADVSDIPSLVSLTMSSNRFPVEILSKLPRQLTSIFIGAEVDVTDEHVKALVSATGLQTIVTGPNRCRSVSNEGLLALRGLKNLKHLEFVGSQITRHGVASMRENNPAIVVYR